MTTFTKCLIFNKYQICKTNTFINKQFNYWKIKVNKNQCLFESIFFKYLFIILCYKPQNKNKLSITRKNTNTG